MKILEILHQKLQAESSGQVQNLESMTTKLILLYIQSKMQIKTNYLTMNGEFTIYLQGTS